MYGIDISKWQKEIDLKKAKYDFCIIKATEGIGYTDPEFNGYVFQLTELNKLMGFYHFARPDLHPTVKDMEAEAVYFLERLDRYDMINNGILVLDWEREPFDNESLVEAWLAKVYELTGVRPFIYGSRSKLTKWKNWGIMKIYPIWMAVWPTIKNYPSGENPGLKIPSKGTIPWAIWQYSAKGRCEGYSSDVDLDFADLTEAQWRDFAGMVKKPEPKPDVEEKISSDMKWAIDSGLFVGYPDGTFKPRDPLTREQAATLFHKYTELLKGIFQ